jgi:hypothetical protein
MGKDGLGYNDKGRYASEALQGWVMHGTETDPDTPVAQGAPGLVGKMKGVVWKKAVPGEKQVGKDKVKIDDSAPKIIREIVEEPLGEFERQILQLWPEINKIWDTTGPGSHEQNVKRAHTYPDIDEHAHRSPYTRGESSGVVNGRDGLKLETGELKRRTDTA